MRLLRLSSPVLQDRLEMNRLASAFSLVQEDAQIQIDDESPVKLYVLLGDKGTQV